MKAPTPTEAALYEDLLAANQRIEELTEILDRKNAIILLLAMGEQPDPMQRQERREA